MTQTFQGGCRCGRIRVEFTTARGEDTFVPRACQCSLCRAHAAAYLSDPLGSIVVRTSGKPTDIGKAGLGITDFHICGRCGVLVAATTAAGAPKLGVVNLHALNDAARFEVRPTEVGFDGEDVPHRTARRQANWTSATVLTEDYAAPIASS